VSLQFDFSRAPKIVFTDPVILQQILINLVSNALKFTKEGHVSVIVTHDKTRVHFIIEDTGVGIKEDFVQNKLFQPFQQEESLLQSKIRGLGLGLSLTKTFAANIDASITVKSSKGMGSVFTVSLPWDPAHDDQQCVDEFHMTSLKSTAQLGYRKGGQTVPSGPPQALIVDDNAINRRVLSSLMSRLGFECADAKTGEEAVEFMKTRKEVDVILMDVYMPGIGGFEAVRQIHALPLAKKPKVIVCSADSSDDINVQCKTLGAAILPKPVKKADLVHLLNLLQTSP